MLAMLILLLSFLQDNIYCSRITTIMKLLSIYSRCEVPAGGYEVSAVFKV